MPKQGCFLIFFILENFSKNWKQTWNYYLSTLKYSLINIYISHAHIHTYHIYNMLSECYDDIHALILVFLAMLFITIQNRLK